jgi:DNA/RNA endonuclease YhcR with UshA esterase domain
MWKSIDSTPSKFYSDRLKKCQQDTKVTNANNTILKLVFLDDFGNLEIEALQSATRTSLFRLTSMFQEICQETMEYY